jgi:hypothetical protein
MRLGSAFAWLLALLLGSLAGVLMYTSLRVPQPTEVRPIRVWQDSRAGDHVAESGNKLEGGVRELGRGAATQRESGDGGGAPAGDDGGGEGGTPDRDDGRSGVIAVDLDGDGHVGDVPDGADDSGAGGAAPAPDDALELDDDQGRGGDDDEPRDGDGGGED